MFFVVVGGRDRRYPGLRHMIDHPTKVLADSVGPDVPWAIDVTSAGGTQTIVGLHHPSSGLEG